jgi:hypothetical protein
MLTAKLDPKPPNKGFSNISNSEVKWWYSLTH